MALAIFKPKAGEYRFRIKVSGATIAEPVDEGRDLRAIVTLGADVAASNAGPCGSVDSPVFDCKVTPNGKTLKCRGY